MKGTNEDAAIRRVDRQLARAKQRKKRHKHQWRTMYSLGFLGGQEVCICGKTRTLFARD